mmetsp:Transcript_17570/g.28410  ORF Transcript_17570/g.28410 Transcript_17570/m.28410 type:complete len:206 (+) Transcript_17570:115-732(+)
MATRSHPSCRNTLSGYGNFSDLFPTCFQRCTQILLLIGGGVSTLRLDLLFYHHSCWYCLVFKQQQQGSTNLGGVSIRNALLYQNWGLFRSDEHFDRLWKIGRRGRGAGCVDGPFPRIAKIGRTGLVGSRVGLGTTPTDDMGNLGSLGRDARDRFDGPSLPSGHGRGKKFLVRNESLLLVDVVSAACPWILLGGRRTSEIARGLWY